MSEYITDIVIDLETLTLDTSMPKGIIQIGAVGFNRDKLFTEDNVKIFNIYPKFDEARVYADSATIKWWMQTNPELLKLIEEDSNRYAINLLFALESLQDWIEEVTNNGKTLLGVWGNGVMMDIAFLNNAYKQNNCKTPWTYKQEACYRTFMTQVVPEGFINRHLPAVECFLQEINKNNKYAPDNLWVKHFAVYDAFVEATILSEALMFLKDNGVLCNAKG